MERNSFPTWIGAALLIAVMVLQSCTSTLKTVFVPPNVVLDTTGPHYLHNISEIKYWDRITAADRATNFGWMDSIGKIHEMNDFYDKIVVLTFFSTWSPPSVNEVNIADSARATGDTNILYLAVAMKEGVLAGKAVILLDSFARARNIPLEILVGSPDFGFTYGGIDAVPTTFVITRRRKISATFEGFVSEGTLLDAISEAEKKQ